MNRDLLALSGQYFDLLVIGGGIFGAAVARDAALRGLRVALIEKSDFASGTSSRSSKLIHGGFRYLQQRDFRLVFEACRERHILQRTAPHLVRPLPFLFPIYKGGEISLTKLRLGMSLYDWLALRRNVAPHRTLSVERTLMTSRRCHARACGVPWPFTIARRTTPVSASTTSSTPPNWVPRASTTAR